MGQRNHSGLFLFHHTTTNTYLFYFSFSSCLYLVLFSSLPLSTYLYTCMYVYVFVYIPRERERFVICLSPLSPLLRSSLFLSTFSYSISSGRQISKAREEGREEGNSFLVESMRCDMKVGGGVSTANVVLQPLSPREGTTTLPPLLL